MKPPAIKLDYAELLLALKVKDADVVAAWRVGSQVYGCADAASDEDFVVVLWASLARPAQDLVRRSWAGRPINVTLHTPATFTAALTAHSVFALECLFAPTSAVLKRPVRPLVFKLDRARLVQKASETADADFKKAQKLLDMPPAPPAAAALGAGRKKLYHSIRVQRFAAQILASGAITDFGVANDVWYHLRDAPADWTWADYCREVPRA